MKGVCSLCQNLTCDGVLTRHRDRSGRQIFYCRGCAHPADEKWWNAVREPPSKPPWQQFMDKNVRLAKLLKLKEIAYWLGTQVVWEFGKQWLFGRKCQPAQS